MNAVIALCHFCEAHGPSAIFCTQTIRDTNTLSDINLEEYQKQLHQEQQKIPASNKNCLICTSIGLSTGIISKDSESNANFISTQIPIIPEVRSLIKQASVRSLSCEVNCSRDSFVFFGDSSRGHVLSHSFHVSDIQARGFYQLFSIIILMKDKFFLLNIKPFLSEHLQKISEELKTKAKIVYNAEQEESGSGRNRRLCGEENSTQTTPRSLIELTKDKNIYYLLHTHFTWILLAGSRFLTEQITFFNIPWTSVTLKHNNKNLFDFFHKETNTNSAMIVENCDPLSNKLDANVSLRHLKDLLQNDFISACYCALTGIKIIIRGPLENVQTIFMCLRKILPREMHKLTQFNCPQYLTNGNIKIVTCLPEIAVPLSNKDIYRIDLFNESKISVKWQGSVPQKLPNLLNKILKAVDEQIFTDLVLEKHLNVLIEEWKNKVICLNHIKSTNDVAKMKMILGIQPHDLPIVDYWKLFL